MMATSMGPNFSGGHPAGMGHPGVPGHAMGPGMPQNPGQQGGPAPGGVPPQFAGGPMAVSAPGGQVNPALMGGMPPGAAPHGPAFQHMNPAQQQQFLQQQQQFQSQFQNHPNAMAAMRQQQQLFQHQQARQMMAQQQAYNASLQAGGGMPMGMQLNPQQFHQLRQAGRLPPGQQHPQQALAAQQYALQQQAQHAQQAQQAQQGGPQQHGPQQGPQPQQQQQQQQQQPGPMNAQAMQAMGQPNQPGGPGQNPMAGQHAQQPQQGQPPQVQTPSQAPSQPPQQAHHTPQRSQAGTPAPGGQQQTPTQTPGSTTAQGQGPQPGPQPQPQPQPQQGQPHPQGQGQAPGQAPGQPQPGQPQQGQQQQPMQMNAAAAHQLALQNSLMAQQRQRQSEGMRGQCLLRLMQFGEQLSGFPGAKTKDDLSYWNAFVDRFFAQDGVFRHSFHVTDSGEPSDKQYEIAFPAIARYFHTHFGSGVRNMQLVLEKGTMDRPLSNDTYFLENPKASLVYWFETGSHLVAQGTLRAQFNAQCKMELLEFITTSHEEYISRKQVIEAAKPAHNWIKEWRNVNNSDPKQSPELSKKGKGKQLKSPQSHPPEVLVDLPDTAVNSRGVTAAVHQFLEIVEVMGQMNPLFGFYHATPGLGPYAALEQYVATNIVGGGGPGMNGQPGPQNVRTPSFGQFPMGASPAAAHMNLPGSPHIGGSPAQGQMQAPAMQIQQSQQGTSSSGPSANTSPASNKRRRPSGVKTEDDGSGAATPQMNGMQNRPGKPATPRMTKRAKTNANQS